jgi:hypothetical protein
MTDAPSRLVQGLAERLGELTGKRVMVEVLLDHAHMIDPGLVGDPAGSARFRAALDELLAGGLLTFPSDGSRTGWDRRVNPALPRWVMRRAPAPPIRERPRPRVWPHVLEHAGRLATREDEYLLLERVATWLRDNPEPVQAPVQERSLELFGDEKALDRYAKTRLFTSRALSLELLACYQPPLPFASQHIPGQGRTALLVVENLATYTSFITVLRGLPERERPDIHIAWGHGGEFNRSVRSVPLLAPAPATLYYFGDLDVAGIDTAVKAAAAVADLGLPPLLPALGCYTYLLAGKDAWRRPDVSNSGSGSGYSSLCAWFPERFHPELRKLFQARERIPQERLGSRELHEDPSPLTHLTLA